MTAPIHHWIDGAEVSGRSGRTGPVFNPATGEQTGAVDLAGAAEVVAAIDVATAGRPRLAPRVAVQAGSDPVRVP